MPRDRSVDIDNRPFAEARRLRDLAAWYRAYAERTANPAIWDARLRTADDLEAEATRIERMTTPS
jgi:hypothetical protein